MTEHILFSIASIGILIIACQWISWWVRLPAILFLLISGILVGPVTGFIDPDQLLGDLLFPLVSLSVAVILFEGSLTLKLNEIRGLGKVVRNLITIGALTTWIIVACATHLFYDFSYALSFLFGAIVIVTGPTVIMPMLRTVRPNEKIANILKWEGITIDSLGALLAVLVYNFLITANQYTFSDIILALGKLVLVGVAAGGVAAILLGHILKNHWVPEYLRNVLTLTTVVGVYVLANAIENESGLLAVTIMGAVMANMPKVEMDDIVDFKESLSVLLISGLFIILAARIELYQLAEIGWPAFAVLATIILVARPATVFISSFHSDLNLREKILISWIGPRGIVAASIAALFAIQLENIGYPGAGQLVPLTFLVIIGTVVIQSATAKQIALWLKVREPPPEGILIIGAGNVGRAIGKTLQKHGFHVLLTDSTWENIRLARMENLNTYYGNPISEHADRSLNLIGLGRMLAVSGRNYLDTLACLRFKPEFGAKNVYELKTISENTIADKHTASTRHRGFQLFGDNITYGMVAGWLRKGAKIKSTQLSDEFSFKQYTHRKSEHYIPLFAIDRKGLLHVFTADSKINPQADWTIISLIASEQSQ